MLDETLARGWENLVSRWGGPMSFRLLMQPLVAILFAVRAGIKDARQNKPPFLWAAHSSPGLRRAWMRQAWTDVGTVFIVALILDAIYQIVVHAGVFTLELLITATLLALLPYVALRGLVTRVASWAGVGKQSDRSMANDEETGT